jgi:hypothetical protein
MMDITASKLAQAHRLAASIEELELAKDGLKDQKATVTIACVSGDRRDPLGRRMDMELTVPVAMQREELDRRLREARSSIAALGFNITGA